MLNYVYRWKQTKKRSIEEDEKNVTPFNFKYDTIQSKSYYTFIWQLSKWFVINSRRYNLRILFPPKAMGYSTFKQNKIIIIFLVVKVASIGTHSRYFYCRDVN